MSEVERIRFLLSTTLSRLLEVIMGSNWSSGHTLSFTVATPQPLGGISVTEHCVIISTLHAVETRRLTDWSTIDTIGIVGQPGGGNVRLRQPGAISCIKEVAFKFSCYILDSGNDRVIWIQIDETCKIKKFQAFISAELSEGDSSNTFRISQPRVFGIVSCDGTSRLIIVGVVRIGLFIP